MVIVKDVPEGPAMRCLSLSLISMTALLAGCGTLDDIRTADEVNVGYCPNTFALEDAASVIEFDGEPSLETIAWSAEIKDVRSNCRYVRDRPIEAVVEVDMSVGKGPAAQGEVHEVSYFVAVMRTNREVIAKEVFTKQVRIRGDIASIDITEDIKNVIIPRRDESISGTNFEIAVGFALTRDQLLYNRRDDSLKFPEL
ncbi:hypothetical protein [Parvularcula marina]|nr:hypothetical protein [Parvularcula marina]